MDQNSNLKELAVQKEKEWKELTELRLESLEAAIQEKEKQLEEGKAKFFKLKEDFKYNLKLLEERDKELEHYDLKFRELKAKCNAQTAENSELKIKIDELSSSIGRECKSREDLQVHYQQRLREKQREIDNFRNKKESEVQEERKEYEKFKRKLQRRLAEVEEELDIQRRELTAGFDEAVKKREHEMRMKMDEMSSQALAHQLKAKMLDKELEMVKNVQDRTSEDFQQVETNHKELEKRLRQKDWEMADMKSLKDATIAELEAKVSKTESGMKRLQEDFQRRYADMDRYGREKEAALTKTKEGCEEREGVLQETIRDLQARLEASEVEVRRLHWANQDLAKDKELQMEKLSGELLDIRQKWDHQVVELSRDQVEKDVRYQAMREQSEKLNEDLQQKKHDIERYKKELSQALERESNLERSKSQLELDWQRRCEDLERLQYSKSEDLVAKLTRARDAAIASAKEKEREGQQKDQLVQQMRTDREQALATLKHHGIAFNRNVNVLVAEKDVEDTELEELRVQNRNLMIAIGEMRKEMEYVGHGGVRSPRPRTPKATTTNIPPEYVQALEVQLSELKKKCRDLEQETETILQYGRVPVQAPPPDDTVLSEVKDNALVRSHIHSLNDLTAGLRAEKVELTAQLKKQQARLQFVENTAEQLSKQPRQKQVEIDQLQYEMNAQSRRHQAEVASLRQKACELELQLVETRKEADEYYKGTLERNMEVTTLQNELSNLKLDMARKRPPINFGAQELVIQQLEDELNRLRQSPAGPGHMIISDSIKTGQGLTTNATIEQLQTKLKSAAKHIAQLAREKQQLIEIGNKQRAELLKTGVEPPRGPAKLPEAWKQNMPVPRTSHVLPQTVEPPSNPFDPPSSHMSQHIQGKLSQLEKLQYQLTKQELQYAQRFSPPHAAGRVNHSQEDEDQRPVSILKKSKEGLNTRSTISTMGNGDHVGDTQQTTSSLGGGRTERELLMSLSSAGGESLQDVWNMLEQPSPSPITPRYTKHHDGHGERTRQSVESRPDSSMEWLVAGRKADLDPRPRAQQTNSAKSKPSANKTGQKPKIRNYNVKDNLGR